MNYQVHSVSCLSQVRSIYEQMNDLYGEQDHYPYEILEQVYLNYPRLVNLATDEQGNQIGHICLVPFNKSGYEKMLDAESDESDLQSRDIFDQSKDKVMYLFVYSIYSKSSYLTKEFIRKTIEAAKEYHRFIDEESIIFAEVVSKEGGLLARRMNLRKYHTYTFRSQKLSLYKSSISGYIESFVQ